MSSTLELVWLQPMGAGTLKREASAVAREWLWENYIPVGWVNILAAYPKVGKSTFLWPLIVAISQGKPFMGLKTQRTHVLVLSEEPLDVIQERLEALGCVENDPYLTVHAFPKDIDQDALNEIERWMKNTHGLLVIDTIAEYAGIEEESSNGEIVRRLKPIKLRARAARATVIFVHHDRKNGEDADEGKMIRGGSAYLGIVDQAFMMARTGGKDSRRRVIRVIGRHRSVPKRTEVEWDGEVGFEMVSAEGSTTGPAKTGAEVKLWKVLPEGPAEGITAEEAATRAGIHRVTAVGILKSWEGQATASATGTGRKNDPKRYTRNGVAHPLEGIRANSLQNQVSGSSGETGCVVSLPLPYGDPALQTMLDEPVDLASAEAVLGRIGTD